MAKYYCGLCETSHNVLKANAKCPECGRSYCIDSIKESINVGKGECPYCDSSYDWFTDPLLSNYKRKIKRKN